MSLPSYTLYLALAVAGVADPPPTMTLMVGDYLPLERKDLKETLPGKDFSKYAEIRSFEERRLILGKAPGTTSFDVTDKDGKRETIRLVVCRPVLLPLGRSKLLRMSSGQPIHSATPSGPGLEVQILKENPAIVAVRTDKRGDLRLILKGKDGGEEPIALFARSDRVPSSNAILMRPGDMFLLKPAGLGEVNRIMNERDHVAEIRLAPDGTASVTGRQPGVTWIECGDEGGKQCASRLLLLCERHFSKRKRFARRPPESQSRSRWRANGQLKWWTSSLSMPQDCASS